MKLTLLILFYMLLCPFRNSAQDVGIVTFATGFTNPVDIASAGDARLFVVEQAGRIKVLNPDGNTNSTPFLNITSLVSSGGERGLLGLAFHPNYATNGYFYVNYTNTSGNTVIARYSVSTTNPDVANPATASTIITINQPESNHNGGTIKFGPDGYLYIGMGDGGGAGDTNNRAQNINLLLGKMLRLDVDGGAPYAIPADNPYAGSIPGADEIWAIGLRNPWKFSFNRSNGELWIADVGQNAFEEINRVSSTLPGLNYGWRCYEGNAVYNSTGCPPQSSLVSPVATYGRSQGASITGGYVYTGTQFPALSGKYFFADYFRNRLGMVNSDNSITYSNNFTGNNNFSTFGQDANGELYVAANSQGIIYKIVDNNLSNDQFTVNGFKLYPNPVESEFTIENQSNIRLQRFTIVDMSGKILLEHTFDDSPKSMINAGNLDVGVYVVTIEDIDGNRYVSKFNKK
ncbi:T9SS type A sorting domain-containing protein [Flavobacterium sp. NST-5]|uniref:T9SS type A sorting domain-containing protein n=1 Tax=Flavobacterium ichthyis TaxID=2698827 RepID=A0ABW9Z7T1_9FLAO|nr:PQQ-dependent sugar dehydrogenase [Flavobacterium ichthyis]NBL64694.1 T9SS type A sorting domain-containing protein [Flavobacterium ichthyis]